MSNNVVFLAQAAKNDDDFRIQFYMHWGNNVIDDVRDVLWHARPRWGDAPYANRMALSFLVKEDVLGEKNFGIEVYDPERKIHQDFVPIICWESYIVKILDNYCVEISFDDWINKSNAELLEMINAIEA